MYLFRTMGSLAASLLYISAAYAAPTSSTTINNGNPCANKAPISGMTCYDFTRPNGEIVPVFVRTEPAIFPNGTAIKNSFHYTPKVPQDQCGQSNFIQATNMGSPKVDDCKAIAEWASINDGGWVITQAQLKGSEWYMLYQINTCGFAVGQQNPDDQPYYGDAVGNTDVADLINDAARQLSMNDQLSATGNMPCTSMVYDTPYSLNWIIGTPGAGWENSGSGGKLLDY